MLRCIKDLQYGDKMAAEKGRLYEVIDQDRYYVYVDGIDYSFSYDEIKEYFQEISKEEIREMKKSFLIHKLYHTLSFIEFRGDGNPATYEERINLLADMLSYSTSDSVLNFVVVTNADHRKQRGRTAPNRALDEEK